MAGGLSGGRLETNTCQRAEVRTKIILEIVAGELRRKANEEQRRKAINGGRDHEQSRA